MSRTRSVGLAAAVAVLLQLAVVSPQLAAARSDSGWWSAAPVAWQGGALTGVVTASDAKKLSKFKQVVFNKRQGRDEPSVSCEQHIVEACRAVKKVNPDVPCLMYLNTKLVFTNYAAAAALTTSELLHGSNGKVVTVPTKGNGNAHLVDYTQPAVARQYLADVYNTTRRSAGALDGGYLDRFSYGDDIVDDHVTKAKARAYYAGENEAVKWLSSALGSNYLFVHCDFIRPLDSECRDIAAVPSPGVTTECFWPTASALELMEAAVAKADKSGQLLRAEAKVDCSDEGQMATTMAAFLVSAGPNTLLMCGSYVPTDDDDGNGMSIPWFPQWELPLGKPSPTVKSGSTWTRKFSSGAVATFDAKSQTGSMTWSDGSTSVGTAVHGTTAESC